MSPLLALIRREVALSFGGGGGLLAPLAFFTATVVLAPLTLGPDLAQLRILAPTVLLVGLALSTLLGLETQWRHDDATGALGQLCLGPLDLSVVAGVKIMAHWLAQGLALAVITPVYGIMLGLPPAQSLTWAAIVAVCGLGFSAIGSLAAALSVASRRPGVVMAVLALPLYVPLAVFGAGVIERPGAWGLVVAVTLMAVVLCPLGIAAALRALDLS